MSAVIRTQETWSTATKPVSGTANTNATGVNTRSWFAKRVAQTFPDSASSDTDTSKGEVQLQSGLQPDFTPPNSAPSSWLEGTVLNVESESVTCEIRAESGSWQIALPAALFKDDVAFGTPMRVGVKHVNGYRTPVVEVVKIRPKDDPEINALREELLAL